MPVVCTVEENQNAMKMGWEKFTKLYIERPKFVDRHMAQTKEWFETTFKKDFPDKFTEILEAKDAHEAWIAEDPARYVHSKIEWDTARADDLSWKEHFKEKLWKAKEKLIEREAYMTNYPETYERMRLYPGVEGQAELMLKEATYDVNKVGTTENGELKFLATGEGYQPVMKRMPDEYATGAYIVARRLLDLSRREGKDKIKGISEQDIEKYRELIARDGERLEPEAQEINALNKRVLFGTLVSSGIISPEQGTQMVIKNPMYIPLHRMIDDLRKTSDFKAGLTAHNPIHKIKGDGYYLISNPFDTIAENVRLFTKAAMKNEIAKAIVRDAQNNPHLKDMVVKIEEPKIKMTEGIREIEGMLGEDAGAFGDEIIQLMDSLRDRSFVDEKGGVLRVWENGKQESYRIDPKVAEILAGMTKPEVNAFTKIMSYPAAALRKGATSHPMFIAKQAVKDSFEAYVYSQYGHTLGIDSIKGLFKVIGNHDDYKVFVAKGGAYSTMRKLGRSGLHEAQMKLAERKNKGLLKLFLDPREWFKQLEHIGEIQEMSTRVQEFSNAVKVEGTSERSLGKATLAGRDITVDFARTGSDTVQANSAIAFFNARIQGLSKMMGLLVDVKKDVKGNVSVNFMPENIGKFTMRATKALIAPSLLLAAMNVDQKWYEEIPDWQKQLFWIHKVGDKIIRIPKPNDMYAITNLPEAIVQYMYKRDPKVVKQYAFDNMVELGISQMIPTAMLPVIENWANKTFFTKQKIVPAGQEGLLQRHQYSHYTTEVGKKLGGLIASTFGEDWTLASPAKLENLYRAWTGSLGRDILDLIDRGVRKAGGSPVRPAEKLSELPFFRDFMITHPMSNTQAVREYYENYEEASKFKKSIDLLMREGKRTEAAKMLAQRKHIRSTRGYQRMRKMSQAVRGIRDNPYMSAEEKAMSRDAIFLQMTQLAEILNEQMKRVKK